MLHKLRFITLTLTMYGGIVISSAKEDEGDEAEDADDYSVY